MGGRQALAEAEDPRLDDLARLYRAGEYAAVLHLCRAMLEEYPDNPFLLRIKGVSRMDLGQSDAAVRTLERALAANPESLASRYYLAQAYAYAGHLASAVPLLHEIIAVAPESGYAGQARHILPRIEGMMRAATVMPEQRSWNLYLGVSADYDDNITGRASDSEDSSPTDAWRLTSSLYGEFRPVDQEATRAPFTLGLGYSNYATWHEDDHYRGYDVFSHRGSVFTERRGTVFRRSASVRLTGNYAHTDLGSEPYNEAIEAELDARLWWLRSAMLSVQGSWATRAYHRKSEFPDYFSLDGTEWQAGVRHHLHMFRNRVRLGLEYSYRETDTEGSQFRHNSHQGGVSLSVAAPLGLRALVSLRYTERDYIDFVPEPRRIDDVLTGNVSLARSLLKDRLELRVAYSTQRSRSSWGFAESLRDVYTLGLNLAL